MPSCLFDVMPFALVLNQMLCAFNVMFIATKRVKSFWNDPRILFFRSELYFSRYPSFLTCYLWMKIQFLSLNPYNLKMLTHETHFKN
ncbi:MAG: hypothetical protein CL942_08395 [Desulfovibrio sp.]|nr:hypothetical protein [Desulfovibrio sp.]